MTTLPAEYISILHLLHPVPLQPTTNTYDQLPVFREGYTLSLQTERRLASVLSFLASATDGPDAIPAVCLAEVHTPPRLQILLAVNKRSSSDSHQTLQHMREALDMIIQSLSQNWDGGSEGEQNIFAAIVAARSARILCRLRLLPNSRKKTKEPLTSILQRAIDAVKPRGASEFIKGAKEVISLLNAWKKYQVQTRLENLVIGIWNLKQLDGLASLIMNIPNTAMEPTARDNLLNILRKVARYREAARFLRHTARKNSLGRRMQIVLVELPRMTYDHATPKPENLSLALSLEQVNGQISLDQLCQLLRVTKPDAEARFVEQATKALNGKIHSEIQLLFHCDQQEFQLAPRVVSSSKAACFLCDTLIRLQGKMHTPRSHGKLYPAWRLPHIPHSGLQQQFADLLKSKIRDSIRTLVLTRKKTLYPDPNESTLSTLVLSSTAPSISVQTGSALFPLSSTGSTRSSIPSQANCLTSSQLSSHSAHGRPDGLIRCTNSPSTRLPTSTSSDETRPHQVCQQRAIEAASDAISGHNPPQVTAAINKTSVHRVGPFEIHIEYPDKLDCSVDTDRWNLMSHLLTVQESDELNGSSIIDVEALQGEIVREWDDRGCIYLGACGTVLELALQASPDFRVLLPCSDLLLLEDACRGT